MGNHRRENSSGDKFSFPVFPPVEDHGSSFEFDCATTPGSPNSPADHLFFNGRLLPHAFPCQPANSAVSFSRSTSSVSSKDSFMSSRSNSTNSRSSSCSSARTSTSEAASERKLLSQAKVGSKTSVPSDRYRAKKPMLTQHYGSSHRWQFITPAPPLKHPGSCARKVHQIGEREQLKSKNQANKNCIGRWFGWRFFRTLVSACKECHAIKPSTRKYVAKS